GNGLGYSSVLVLVACVRELLGSGTLLGYKIVPESVYAAGFSNNGLMLLAPGAFIVLGLLIWAQRTATGHTETD
ncbi:MAG: Rnf-Nqr domain containing protein, partial [Kiritimatiellia bacterium]|nr:Rnf-Nqr domain containing protein [Kiritimatiellia bacterium]